MRRVSPENSEHSILNVTTARANLPQLLKGNKTVFIGRRYRPSAVLVPIEQYEALLCKIDSLENGPDDTDEPPVDDVEFDLGV